MRTNFLSLNFETLRFLVKRVLGNFTSKLNALRIHTGDVLGVAKVYKTKIQQILSLVNGSCQFIPVFIGLVHPLDIPEHQALGLRFRARSVVARFSAMRNSSREWELPEADVDLEKFEARTVHLSNDEVLLSGDYEDWRDVNVDKLYDSCKLEPFAWATRLVFHADTADVESESVGQFTLNRENVEHQVLQRRVQELSHQIRSLQSESEVVTPMTGKEIK
ncbi:hypothetical protein HDU93_004786, partial [Gonapodya sp. JEL0774]